MNGWVDTWNWMGPIVRNIRWTDALIYRSSKCLHATGFQLQRRRSSERCSVILSPSGVCNPFFGHPDFWPMTHKSSFWFRSANTFWPIHGWPVWPGMSCPADDVTATPCGHLFPGFHWGIGTPVGILILFPWLRFCWDCIASWSGGTGVELLWKLFEWRTSTYFN